MYGMLNIRPVAGISPPGLRKAPSCVPVNLPFLDDQAIIDVMDCVDLDLGVENAPIQPR